MHNQEQTSTNMRSNLLCLSSILSIILLLCKSASCNKRLDSNSREILRLHRKYRKDLVDCKVDGQPPAQYMSPLKWNYNLAAHAQTLANKCTLQQELPYSVEFLCVGQNIALYPTIKSVNWNNEQPYEVKSRESCPKMQNIPKDSFQTMRDNTQRAPLSKVNVNHKLSTTGSSGNRVLHKRPNSRCISLNYIGNIPRNTQNIWMSGKKAEHKLSKSVRGGSGHGFVQGQHNGKIVRHKN
ncbi:unnamed protein product [Schistosoma margrebowiei]|uniref:SCP domain-containing protein n=1 Tax=Schistosoma margrebowiei TaxID=48269 RepID=A0A183M8G7_9TREM|nr:unnamed protein product [Schistosoma margrebowiei]